MATPDFAFYLTTEQQSGTTAEEKPSKKLNPLDNPLAKIAQPDSALSTFSHELTQESDNKLSHRVSLTFGDWLDSLKSADSFRLFHLVTHKYQKK